MNESCASESNRTGELAVGFDTTGPSAGGKNELTQQSPLAGSVSSAAGTARAPEELHFEPLSQSVVNKEWQAQVSSAFNRHMRQDDNEDHWQLLCSPNLLFAFIATPIVSDAVIFEVALETSTDPSIAALQLHKVITTVQSSDPSLASARPAIKALAEILSKKCPISAACRAAVFSADFIRPMSLMALAGSADGKCLMRALIFQSSLQGISMEDLLKELSSVVLSMDTSEIQRVTATELLVQLLRVTGSNEARRMLPNADILCCQQDLISDEVLDTFCFLENGLLRSNEEERISGVLSTFEQLIRTIYLTLRSEKLSGSSHSSSSRKTFSRDAILQQSFDLFDRNFRAFQEQPKSVRLKVANRQQVASEEALKCWLYPDDGAATAPSQTVTTPIVEVLAGIFLLPSDQIRLSGSNYEESVTFRHSCTVITSDLYVPYVDPASGTVLTKAYWHFCPSGTSRWAVGIVPSNFTGGKVHPLPALLKGFTHTSDGYVIANVQPVALGLGKNVVFSIDAVTKLITVVVDGVSNSLPLDETMFPCRLAIAGGSNLSVRFINAFAPLSSGHSAHSNDFNLSGCGVARHSGLMRCNCGHGLGVVPYPLDASFYHLNNSCTWLCCGKDWQENVCSKLTPAAPAAVASSSDSTTDIGDREELFVEEHQKFRNAIHESDRLVFGKHEFKNLASTLLDNVFHEVLFAVLSIFTQHPSGERSSEQKCLTLLCLRDSIKREFHEFPNAEGRDCLELAVKVLSLFLLNGFGKVVWIYFYRPLVYKFSVLARIILSSGQQTFTPSHTLKAINEIHVLKEYLCSLVNYVQTLVLDRLDMFGRDKMNAFNHDYKAHYSSSSGTNIINGDNAAVNTTSEQDLSSVTESLEEHSIPMAGGSSVEQLEGIYFNPCQDLKSLSVIAIRSFTDFVEKYLLGRVVAADVLGGCSASKGHDVYDDNLTAEIVSYVSTRFGCGFPLRSHKVRVLLRALSCCTKVPPLRSKLGVIWVEGLGTWLWGRVKDTLTGSCGEYGSASSVVTLCHQYLECIKDCSELDFGFLALSETVIADAVRAMFDKLSRIESEQLLVQVATHISTMLRASSVPPLRTSTTYDRDKYNRVVLFERDLRNALDIMELFCRSHQGETVQRSGEVKFHGYDELLIARLLSRDTVSSSYELLASTKMAKYSSQKYITEYIHSLEGSFGAIRRRLLQAMDSSTDQLAQNCVNTIFGSGEECVNVAVVGQVGSQLLQMERHPVCLQLPPELQAVMQAVDVIISVNRDISSYFGQDAIASDCRASLRKRLDSNVTQDRVFFHQAFKKSADCALRTESFPRPPPEVTTPVKLKWMHQYSTLVIGIQDLCKHAMTNFSSASNYAPPASQPLYLLLTVIQYAVLAAVRNCPDDKCTQNELSVRTELNDSVLTKVIQSLSTVAAPVVYYHDKKLRVNVAYLEMLAATTATTVESPICLLPSQQRLIESGPISDPQRLAEQVFTACDSDLDWKKSFEILRRSPVITGTDGSFSGSKPTSFGHQIVVMEQSSVSCPSCKMYGPSKETSGHYCRCCKFCSVCCVRVLHPCEATTLTVKTPSQHDMILKLSKKDGFPFGGNKDRVLAGMCPCCRQPRGDFHKCSLYECSRCNRCAPCAAQHAVCSGASADISAEPTVSPTVPKRQLEMHCVEYLTKLASASVTKQPPSDVRGYSEGKPTRDPPKEALMDPKSREIQTFVTREPLFSREAVKLLLVNDFCRLQEMLGDLYRFELSERGDIFKWKVQFSFAPVSAAGYKPVVEVCLLFAKSYYPAEPPIVLLESVLPRGLLNTGKFAARFGCHALVHAWKVCKYGLRELVGDVADWLQRESSAEAEFAMSEVAVNIVDEGVPYDALNAVCACSAKELHEVASACSLTNSICIFSHDSIDFSKCIQKTATSDITTLASEVTSGLQRKAEEKNQTDNENRSLEDDDEDGDDSEDEDDDEVTSSDSEGEDIPERYGSREPVKTSAVADPLNFEVQDLPENFCEFLVSLRAGLELVLRNLQVAVPQLERSGQLALLHQTISHYGLLEAMTKCIESIDIFGRLDTVVIYLLELLASVPELSTVQWPVKLQKIEVHETAGKPSTEETITIYSLAAKLEAICNKAGSAEVGGGLPAEQVEISGTSSQLRNIIFARAVINNVRRL
jgi:hypothetical protein